MNRRWQAGKGEVPVCEIMKKTYCVFNKTRETFLALTVSKADTLLAHLKGIAGKSDWTSNEGLWLVAPRMVHTVGVLFSVDLIFLNVNCEVLCMTEHVNPFSILWRPKNAYGALQLPPHTIYASRTNVGDQLIICPVEEVQRHLNQASPKRPCAAAS